MEGQRPLQQLIHRNNRDLVRHEEQRTKKIFKDGAAMTGQEKEKRQANNWRTFNEKRNNEAKTGLFIPNLCETEHPGDYDRVGIFILESLRDLGICTRRPSENNGNFDIVIFFRSFFFGSKLRCLLFRCFGSYIAFK